jgi:ABC-type oligopeptide transport system substrate-binding subunit
MFTLGWGPDYPDQNKMIADLLQCDMGAASTERACNEIDSLIIEAGQETDPARRVQLYRQIEEAFFGPQGEHPIIPIFTRLAYNAFQPWYDYTPIPFYGDQWYNDTIDMQAKRTAQGW